LGTFVVAAMFQQLFSFSVTDIDDDVVVGGGFCGRSRQHQSKASSPPSPTTIPIHLVHFAGVSLS
jgi:hypothetical protein